jgi:hypothetical protein
MPAPDVVFHFDPLCPWTWMTSRWLTEVGAARGLSLGWRSLSLRIVNDIEPGRHEPLDAGFEALRVIEALGKAGDDAGAGRLYTALGEQVHRAKRTLDRALVAEALAAAGIPDDVAAAASDDAWDAAVAASGGGVGSPVIRWPDTGRATSGPIVSPPPTGAAALRLWDVVTGALEIPSFYELKRGRTGVTPQVP